MPLYYNNRIYEGGICERSKHFKGRLGDRPLQHPQYSPVSERAVLSSYANMEALCHWHEDIEYMKALKGTWSTM